MTTEQLKALRRDTDRAIETVRQAWKNNRINDAVNWAGLRCSEAAWIMNDEGEAYAQVTISKAGPEASLFRLAICDALADRNWFDIAIITEW